MKKLLTLALVLLVLLALTACDSGGEVALTPASTSTPEPTATNGSVSEDVPESTPEPIHDAPTMQNGSIAVTEGTFIIGADIRESQYIVTSDEGNAMRIIVFESEQDFDNFYNANRSTFGTERTAIEQNALFTLRLEEESAFLSLRSGFVIMITGGSGVLEEMSLDTFTRDVISGSVWDSSNPSTIGTGVFFVGVDLEDGQYVFTVTDTNFMAMSLVIFESKDDYLEYFRQSRGTHGEETEAIEANARESMQLFEGNSHSFDLSIGNVLMFSDGIGNLEAQNDVAVDTSGVSNAIYLYSGIYFVGDDINAGNYAFTSMETGFGMRVVVFENKNNYLDYFRTGRSTHGEERTAIEKNALTSFYIHEGQICILNLRDGMVLLLKNGSGILETANQSWAR